MEWKHENSETYQGFSTCATRRRNVYTIYNGGKKGGGETKKTEKDRERERVFNTEGHISCFTQYNMAVQPSIVMHWKTVSMANPMLSKLVMPKFGPSQWSMHVEMFASHTWAPNGASDLLSVLHGLACSPSFTITSTTEWTSDRSLSSGSRTMRISSSFPSLLPSFLHFPSFFFSFLFFSLFILFERKDITHWYPWCCNTFYAGSPNRIRGRWWRISRWRKVPAGRSAEAAPLPW